MKKVFLALLVLTSLHTHASVENKSDSLSNVQNVQLEEVVVSATRAGKNTPLSYTNIGKAELKRNKIGRAHV